MVPIIARNVLKGPFGLLRIVSCVTLLFAQIAVAQQEVAAEATPDDPVGELWGIRLRYGAALRSGSQADTGPGMSYSGLTPNDLALSAAVFGRGHLGGVLQLQREGFGLYDQMNRVTAGALLRFQAAVAGRWTFGPLRLEPQVGYAFHQLPTFTSTLAPSPVLSAGARHAVLLAGRVAVDAGPLTIEARGEVPIALATIGGDSRPARSSGFAVGGAVRFPIFTQGTLNFGGVVDGYFLRDTLSVAADPTLEANQQVIRFGAGLDFQWREELRKPYASVLVRVLDADTRGPLPAAALTLEVDGQAQALTLDGEGRGRLSDLGNSTLVAKASLGGYVPGQQEGTAKVGSQTVLEVLLKKESPKVGTLSVTVTEKETQTPLPGAVVVVNGAQTVTTDAQGQATVKEVKPGPASLSVTLDGYQPGEEAASVVAGRSSDVKVSLLPVKKRVPATITGLVRSTKGGKPISADLAIPQAKIRTKATAQGAFSFRLEGGTYTVTISAPGYVTQTKNVTVKDGDQAIFNVDLHPK